MRKDDQINFRISHDDKVMLMQAAQADDKSISEWLIDLNVRHVHPFSDGKNRTKL